MIKFVPVDLGLINSDVFLDMSLEMQALYFYLLANKNQEGIVNNPKAIQRMLSVKEDVFWELGAIGLVLDGDEDGEFYIVSRNCDKPFVIVYDKVMKNKFSSRKNTAVSTVTAVSQSRPYSR